MPEERIIKREAPYVRFVQIDVLRGFAVLGIYFINIILFALPESESMVPPELNETGFLNSSIGMFSEVYIEGTMRALFSMLFGASALIFLDEARLANSGLDLVDRYYRRTLLLVLFGLLHAYLLLWPYDVLYAYGLFGLLLFPIRKLSARTLLIFGILLLLMGDLDFTAQQNNTNDLSNRISNITLGNEATSITQNESASSMTSRISGFIPVGSSNTNPKATTEEASGEESIEIINSGGGMGTYRSDYATIFNFQRKTVVEKQSISIYQDYIFDIGGMMLLGMALFKFGVMTGPLSSKTYLIFVIVGYVAGTTLRYALSLGGLNSGHLTQVFSGYNLGRVLITFGHIGLIGLLCSSVHLKGIVRTLASVGRMALTNYIMQTVISIFLFYGFGFSLYASLQRYQLVMVCAGIWLFQITYSNLWLIWFKQGPLEWLWRSLIYGELQSNRK